MFQSFKFGRERRFTSLKVAVLALSIPAAAHSADLFSVHGSNTIGAHLGPALIQGYLKAAGAADPKVAATDIENEAVISATLADGPVTVPVAAHGSSTGFKALAAGKADIWASSRPAKAKEIEAFSEQADLTSMSAEHVIAIDGLAILVHPDNPLKQLSKADLNRLFTGKISNWKALGGPDLAVTVFARDDRSGTWDTFKSLVLGKDDKLAPGAKRYESNDQLSDDVSRNRGAVGFAGYASIRNSKALAIADGDSPAIAPSQLTIATEDYPLSRRLFFYSRGQANSEAVRQFIAFTESSAGQKIVGSTGFVEQNLIAVDTELDSEVPETFRKLTANYQRLSVNFRFSEGRTRLDNKAQRDVERVIRYLEDHGREARDLMLIGFADRQTDEFRAQQISELRALSVHKALKKEGTEVKAFTGYGHYMPVAQAGGKTGASRNGRVEVWIRRQ